MHTHLLRSKTRFQLKKVTSVLLCLGMAMPVPALAAPPAGTTTAGAVSGQLPGQFGQQDQLAGVNAQLQAQDREKFDNFEKEEGAKQEAFQQSLREHKKQVAALRAKAEAMKAEAQREAAKVYKTMRGTLETLEPERRADVGRLSPKPIAPPTNQQKKSSAGQADEKGAGTEINVGPPKEKGGAAPTKGEETKPAPSSSLLNKSFQFLVMAFGIPDAFADADPGSLVNAGDVETFDPTNNSIGAIENQMKRQLSFVTALGSVTAGLIESPKRGKVYDTFDEPGGPKDYMNAVRKIAGPAPIGYDVGVDSAVKAVEAHLIEMNKIVPAVKSGTAGTSSESGANADSHGTAPQPNGPPVIAAPANEEIRKATVESFTKQDLDVSVRVVKTELNKGLAALEPAKEKAIAASQIEKDASELEANPPAPPKPGTPPQGSGAGQQQPQRPQNAGNGGGQGGGDKGKGAAGQGGQMPQPGGIADSSKLFGSQPETPDVGSVASASNIERQPNPQWENVPGGVSVPPGILRATGNTPVAATSGQVPQSGAPFIQGNMSPGSPIDKSMFGGGGGGGEGGGGDKPAAMGGGAGGTAGGAFGGDDVGRGIGPSYGGRAGLSDAVKRYEVGAGGGSTSSETSSGTIATGAEAGIPQGFANQVATGKKIKEGAGKGGLGLMGQVSTLLQTQCGDTTQRSKFEAFCINASSVAAKGRTRKNEPEADQLAMAGGARRDLASDRGVPSSK